MSELNEDVLTEYCEEMWSRNISAAEGAEVIWDYFSAILKDNERLMGALKAIADADSCSLVVAEEFQEIAQAALAKETP
jgi:hypothetical protein